MKKVRMLAGMLLFSAIAAGAWILLFHADLIKPQHKEEEAEPETDVAVRTVQIRRATLHRYTECYGTVMPAQRRNGKSQAASARMASPVAGVISEVFCVVGQHMEKDEPLFQLDDRIARGEELKAEAALFSAQATYAKLKTSVRPEQVALAEIAVEKARKTLAFAEQNEVRQKALAKDELASEKQLQESAQLVAGARDDLSTAEKQVALLKNSPAPEDLAETAAKIAEAEKALAALKLTRSLLTIKSPLAATVVKINVNPGEPVDTTNILIELADMNRLEVNGAVPAAEIRMLKPGQVVEISCITAAEKTAHGKSAQSAASAQDSSGDTVFQSTLADIGLQIDPKSDTVLVRAALPAESGARPGQSARLKITLEEHRDCLAVPEECVFRDKVGIDVIAVVENGKSSLENVTVGLRENGLLEISGKEIKGGEIVVSAGAYGLPEETKVHSLDAADAPAKSKIGKATPADSEKK